MNHITDTTPHDDTGARLPFCPRCRYSLRGLPGAGRCPECGLAYDEESRMWIGPQPNVGSLVAKYSLALGATLASGLFMLVMGSGLIGPRSRLMLLCGLTQFVCVAFWVRKIYLECRVFDRFLAVLPAGLWITVVPEGAAAKGLYGRDRMFEWKKVRSAMSYTSSRSIQIHFAADKQIYLKGFFQRESDARTAEELINARTFQA